MVLFIYTLFRILLLFLFNIETERSQAQDTTKPVRTDSTYVENNLDVKMALDSALKVVQELKDIPKIVQQGTQKNKRLSRKLDNIYYGSIIPLRVLEPRHDYKAYTIPVRVKELPAIKEVTFMNNELCIDSLPYRVTPEEALSRQRPKFFQRLKRLFRK